MRAQNAWCICLPAKKVINLVLTVYLSYSYRAHFELPNLLINSYKRMQPKSTGEWNANHASFIRQSVWTFISQFDIHLRTCHKWVFFFQIPIKQDYSFFARWKISIKNWLRFHALIREISSLHDNKIINLCIECSVQTNVFRCYLPTKTSVKAG